MVKLGYYLPFSLACGIMMAVGTGLLSMLGSHTSTGKWIGYQIIIGVGRGLGVQMVSFYPSIICAVTYASQSLSLQYKIWYQRRNNEKILGGQPKVGANEAENSPKFRLVNHENRK